MSPKKISHGIVRQISSSLENCELLYIARQKFDIEKARQQHASYVSALEAAGVSMTVLPEEPMLPDATFVEDTVIVLDEIAVICRLGAASRAPEADIIARHIAEIRPIYRIAHSGTIEGGDVLQIGKTLFVGISSRTNAAGIRQLEEIVSRYGYSVVGVKVTGCLHLKTGVTSPKEGVLLANASWIDMAPFRGFEILQVPKSEPWGANTLSVNEAVLVAESSPNTADILEAKGLRVKRLAICELQKAEAGLTCLSVLF